MNRPRSLLILPVAPALGGNGLAMRMGVFAEALARISEAHVLVIPIAGKLPVAAPMPDGITLHTIAAGGGQLESKYALLSQVADSGQRLAAFADWGRPSQSAGLSRPVLSAVAGLVRDLSPDLVHVGRVGLAPCIGMVPGGVPITLDLDEDDRAAFALMRAKNVNRAAWLRQEGLACDRLIAVHGPRASRVYAASAAEKASLAGRHPGLTFAVARNAAPAVNVPRVACSHGRAVFIGSLSYAPNAEGLIWFLRHVMPDLAATGFQLDIAGAGAPPDLQALARRSGAILRGWVPNAAAFYRGAALAILPLHSGGGTRIKLLEAMANETPFVATRRAAAGLGLPPHSGWFADHPHMFANSIRAILSNPIEAQRRATLARRHVQRLHNRNAVIDALARDLHSVFL